MRKQSWTKRDPIKNYFPLPNEIYDLGLSRGAISVYSFLLRREDRKTYQCLLSYREIGEGVGMCVTTVRKYVAELEERSLIRTERTTITTKDGRKRNGRLLYHMHVYVLSLYYEFGFWNMEIGCRKEPSNFKIPLDFDAPSTDTVSVRRDVYGVFHSGTVASVRGDHPHPALVRPDWPAETQSGGGERLPLLWPGGGGPAAGHSLLPGPRGGTGPNQGMSGRSLL